MPQKAKQKVPNGFCKTTADTSTGDTSSEADDIRKHISKITQVSGPSKAHKAKFVPLSSSSKAEREAKTNRKKFPQPRNIKLVESDSDDDNSEKGSRNSEEFFDENAIIAGLKSMKGGTESSNYFLQQRWAKQQDDAPDSSCPTDPKTEQPVTNASKSSRDVFARNIGMRAIMKQKMANTVDSTSKNETEEKGTTASATVNSNQDDKNVGANSCRFPFVQDPLDPDFLSRQLCGLDNDDDFIVEHVGKISSVASRKYLIENVTDEDFVFKRRNS